MPIETQAMMIEAFAEIDRDLEHLDRLASHEAKGLDFIKSLPPGEQVLETSARVQHVGVYQSGIGEIRCMYAPEFHARSGSVKLEVLRKGP